MRSSTHYRNDWLCRSVAALWLGMSLLLSGCNGPAPGPGVSGVTVRIAGGAAAANGQEPGELIGGVMIGTAYPYLSRITLQIVAEGFTTAGINRDYNGGRFGMAEGEDALLLVDTAFLLNVPNEVDLTFIVTAYNLDGYRVFSATSTLTSAQMRSGETSMPIAMQVDIDPAVPVLATDPGCSGDTDGDGLCNGYEDIFVTADGVADIDGDGLLNSEDTDADGDGMPDDFDGNTPANDGFPSFIHANRAPTAVSLAMTTVSGTSVAGSASVTDPDLGDCHSIAIVTPPVQGTAEILLAGALPPDVPADCEAYRVRYTPPDGFTGVVGFTISATDRAGEAISGSVSVTVNEAPPTAPTVADASFVTDEDVPLLITLSGRDINGDTLTFIVVTPPANGTLSGASPDFTYTPGSNFNGSDSFTYRANDGTANSNTATVNITVNPLNDAPLAVNDGGRTVARASLDSSSIEANGESVLPAINDNGRFVVFWSAATSLVAGDNNGVFDLFMRDTQNATTTRLTVDSSGVEADLGQTDQALLQPAAVSLDGRYAAFASLANLGAQAGGGFSQIYLRDTLAQSTSIITACETAGNGDSSEPAMTPDGLFIAFTSLASDPWPACGTALDSNGFSDVYLDSPFDAYGKRRVSVDAQGLAVNKQANGASSQPAIADAGNLIAFTSTASDLVPLDGNGAVSDIFLKNLGDESIVLVSVDSGEVQASGASHSPSISADGRYVAFVSEATNLVTGDSNGVADIFVRDTVAGVTGRVSVDSAGNQANGASSRPLLSKDGRYVLFESQAANLVAGDSNGAGDIFIHDRLLGDTRLLSSDASGTQGNAPSSMTALSGDGHYAAFATEANNLVAADNNGLSDVLALSLTDITTSGVQLVNTPNVLLNDSDVENDPLSVAGNSAAANGTVVDNGDGTFSYTPSPGFVGLDRFGYTVFDGTGSDTATVDVAVGVANYPPQGVADTATTTAAAPVTIPVLANDFDLDGDSLVIGTADSISIYGGSVTINADNTLKFSPGTGMTPPYDDFFTYTASDGASTSMSTTVTVSVQ